MKLRSRRQIILLLQQGLLLPEETGVAEEVAIICRTFCWPELPMRTEGGWRRNGHWECD